MFLKKYGIKAPGKFGKRYRLSAIRWQTRSIVPNSAGNTRSARMQCGFCESTLTRRTRNHQTKYKQVVWHCVAATKGGKKKKRLLDMRLESKIDMNTYLAKDDELKKEIAQKRAELSKLQDTEKTEKEMRRHIDDMREYLKDAQPLK